LVFLIWWLFIVPMRAALRLLRTRIEPGDALLTQVMAAQPRSGRAHPVAVRTTSTVSGASTMYLAAAWALGIVSTAAVLWLISTEHALVGLGLQFAALYAVRMLWRRSRRHAALNSQALQSLDPRAPVLYLRSFGDDPGLMQAEWDAFIKTRAGSIAAAAKRGPGRLARAWRKYSIGWLSTTGRLEEGIAPELANVGPFVGIGAPNERLPELGAARAYFTSETWQDAIVKWVDLARLIIKVAGPTRWIRWELDTIIDRGAPMKLIILMPPVDPGGRLMRWQNLMAELQSTLWAPALGSIDATRLVALRFLEDGKVSIVTGGKGRLLDYLLALRLVLFQLRSPSDVVSRPSAC
jgi:hypothetical protein